MMDDDVKAAEDGKDNAADTLLSSERLISDSGIGTFQRIIVLLCLCVLVIDGLDVQLLALSAPVVMKEWNINAAAFSPALAASLAGMMIGSAIGGKAADRFGRRPVLIASAFGFGMMTGFTAFSNGVVFLAVLRFLGGLGFGAAIPCAMGLASEWVPKHLRPQVLGLLAIGTPLGGMIGAFFSNWLIETFGWRFCFVACGILTLILGLLLLRYLPESPGFLQARGRTDELKSALGKAFGAAAAASIEKIYVSVGKTEPVVPVSIFSAHDRRTTVSLCLAFFSSLFACYALMSWLPVAFTNSGIVLADALRGAFVYTFWSIVGALASGFLMARYGSVKVVFTGLFVAIASLVGIAFVLDAYSANGTGSFATVIAVVAVAGISTGCVQALLYGLAGLSYPTNRRATGIGVAATFGRIGGVAAILSGGAFLSLERHQMLAFFGALAVALAVTGVAMILFDRHRAADRAA